MPISLLFVLIFLVGAYVGLAGTAWVGFILARRKPPPPAPSAWPTVSVVVPAARTPDPEAIEQIRDCDYPTDRLEILALTDDPADPSSCERDDEATVRRVSVPGESAGAPPLSDSLKHAVRVAEGEIVLMTPPEGTVPSGWIRSMARRCPPDTPVVVGPTVIEHEDLFLPRLQALSHLGRLALTTGLSYVGIPSPVETSNRAARVEALSGSEANDPATGRALEQHPPAFNPEAEAVVAQSPVSSFGALLRRLARGLRRTFRSSSWLVRGQGVGLWLLHSVLLACALVAVAVPAWRQPTVLALVTLMGANVVLTLPAAKPYGQRGLLRSIVPTVLMLVVALPIAGLWALIDQFHTPAPESHRILKRDV